MTEEQTPVERGTNVQQLERELAEVRATLARIDAALATVDPDDIDCLTDRRWAPGNHGRREKEIEAELAALRAPPSAAPEILAGTPVVTGVALNSIALLPDSSGILTGGDDGMVLRDAATGAVRANYDVPQRQAIGSASRLTATTPQPEVLTTALRL